MVLIIMIVLNYYQDGLYITDISLAQVYIHYIEPTTSKNDVTSMIYIYQHGIVVACEQVPCMCIDMFDATVL